MAGPSRENRALKAKNDRKKARASRGGRTPSEAALGRSMAAAGNRVSRSNRRATAPPSTRTFSAPRSPRKARRSLPAAKPPSLPGPLGDAQRFAQDRIEDVDSAVRSGVSTVFRELDEDQRRSDRILNDPDSSALSKVVAFVGSPENPVGPGKVASPVTRVRGAKIAGDSVSKSKAVRGAKAAGRAAKNPGGTSRKAVRKAKEGGERVTTKAKRVGRRVKAKSQTKQGRKELAAGTAKGTGRGAAKAGKAVVRRGGRSKVVPAAGAVVLADEQGLVEGNETVRDAANVVRGSLDALSPMNAKGDLDPLWFGKDSEDSPLGRTIGTTWRAVPGVFTGVAAGIGAGAESAYRAGRTGLGATGQLTDNEVLKLLGKEYTGKEIASPVTETVSETAKGLEEMAKPFLAGDREGVSRAIQEQIGLAPIVWTPALLSKLRAAKGYQEARGVLRDAMAYRRSQRAKKVGEERKRREQNDEPPGEPIPPKPETDRGSRRQDEYVIQPLGRAIESRRARKGVARLDDRTTRVPQREANYIARDLIRLLAKSRKIGGKKRSKQFAADLAAVVQVVAQQGLGRNPARVKYELERLLTQISRADPQDPRITGRVGDRQAIKTLLDNPEILESPVFWTAVDRVKEVTREGTVGLKGEDGGRRAQYEASARRMGIPMPEEVVATQGVRVPGKGTVKGEWSPDLDLNLSADARSLREQARALDAKARKLDPASPEAVALVKRSASLTKEATEKIRRRDGLREAYKIAERDFVDKTRSASLLRGQDPEPAYVRDAARAQPGAEGNVVASVGRAGTPVPKKITNEQIRTGELRLSGIADRAFDTLYRESILRPRVIKAIHRLTREVIGRYHIKVKDGRGRDAMILTSKEIADAYGRGEIPEGFTAVHSQFWKGAARGADSRVDDMPIERLEADGVELTVNPADLYSRVVDAQTKSGHKYILVRKAAWDEYINQVQGTNSKWSRGAARVNRMAATGILGYNPSWVAAQQLAEGIPALLAIGMSPAAWNYVIQAERAYQKMTPRQKALIDAVSGSAGGTLRSIGNIRKDGLLDYSVLPPWVRETKLARRFGRREPNQQDIRDFNLGVNERAWASMRSLAQGRGLNEIVLATGGVYRRGAMNAEIYRRRRGAILGLARASTAMREIDRKLERMDAGDAQLYLARNPKEAEKLASYMEDVMGNWTSLTAREGALAPFTAFFPYLRYSIRWTFYGFPKRHPIKATILYFLAQQNANQLKELAGGEPISWLDYAYPVVTADGKSEPMLSGNRFAPGMSAIVEALGVDNPNRLLNTLNPIFGTGLRAVEGDDPFSGERIAYGIPDQLLLGASSLASMLAPIRWSDSLFPGGTTSRIRPQKDYSKPATSDVPILDGIPNRSETSKRFRDLDSGAYPENLLELLGSRSAINIFGRQSGENFREELRLKKLLDEGRYSEASGRRARRSDSSSKKKSSSSIFGGSSSSGGSIFGGSSSSGGSIFSK